MKSKFIQLRLQGVSDPFMSMANDMGKTDAPKAPNYTKLANQQAQAQMDLARYTTNANRVNQFTPYGSLTYSSTPTFNESAYNMALSQYNELPEAQRRKTAAPTKSQYTNDIWTAKQELSPEQQALLEQTQGLSSGKLGYAQDLLNKAAAGQGGVDMSTLPSYGINPGETYSDAIMRRLQPQQAQAKESFDAQMANQGVVPGTAAYDNAYRNFQQGQNDLMTSAIVQGGQYGLAANQQAYQQALQNLNNPINMINSLQGGSQVQNPQYVNPAQQQMTQAPDLVGAAQNQYNAQMNQYNADQAGSGNFFGGLMNLGGTVLSAGSKPWWLG